MELLLIIPVFIFCMSPYITHRIWDKRWTESKKSKAYIRKYFWGFREFLFPAISLYVLLNTNLQWFCIALLGFSIFKILIRLIFGTDRERLPTDRFSYLWYLFVGLTIFQNNPFWIQIWISVFSGSILIYVLTAAILKKPDWITQIISGTKKSSNLDSDIQYWLTPISLSVMFGLNEILRRTTSFETWAFYNAFGFPVILLVIGFSSTIFIPTFYRLIERGKNKS